MSISTYINLLNENDKAYIKAKNGTEADREKYRDYEGDICLKYGGQVNFKDSIIKETDDEYGGWVIALADLPKEATHIYIHRS